MLYPSATEYIDSIRDEDCFDVLKPIQYTTDPQGGIYVVSGGFATVFKVYKPDTGKHYALKCFNKHIADREDRYTALSDYFKLNPRPYFMDYNYYSKELWVNSQSAEDGEYPLLQMEWVEGATLGDYIQEKVDAGDKAALKRLAKSFDDFALDLLAQDFAHGDLKHDNIMVKSDGQLVLIDYDGAYVPALQGKPCEELGSAAYQHPSRSSSSYTRDLDDFSILVLSISLHALGERPELLGQYKGSDNILFKRDDYRGVSKSRLYRALKRIEVLSDHLELFKVSLRSKSVAVNGLRNLFLEREEKDKRAAFLNSIKYTIGIPEGDICIVSEGLVTVFKIYKPDTGTYYALKCFNKHIADREERYSALGNYFNSNPRPYFVDCNYDKKELIGNTQRVEGGECLFVQMEWVEGATLGDYIQEKVDIGDKAALKRLAKSFDELAIDLLAQDFAHGNLKHDNIIVKSDGQLVLIDYDGAYVSALQGKPCEELGSAAYQHPSRSLSNYTRELDDFSILVLSISLHALGERPDLLGKYKGIDNILFRGDDYKGVSKSRLYKALKRIEFLSDHLELFKKSLRSESIEVKGLRAFLLEKEEKYKRAAFLNNIKYRRESERYKVENEKYLIENEKYKKENEWYRNQLKKYEKKIDSYKFENKRYRRENRESERRYNAYERQYNNNKREYDELLSTLNSTKKNITVLTEEYEELSAKLENIKRETNSDGQILNSGGRKKGILFKKIEEWLSKKFTFIFRKSIINTCKKTLTSSSIKVLNYNKYVLVEGGSFIMGSDGRYAYNDEKPVHRVSLDTFYISKYAVTFEEYDTYCDVTGVEKPSDEGWGRGRRPVINISWSDAVAYAKWLSKEDGKMYRLPTEAEWEYAARGGKLSKGYEYAGSDNIDEVAWYSDNSSRQIHKVGQKKSNELGLYDMSGNIWEFCSDWYGENYYSNSLGNNPKGPRTGTKRVLRGSSYFYFARSCRVFNRNCISPDFRYKFNGFRLLLQADTF